MWKTLVGATMALTFAGCFPSVVLVGARADAGYQTVAFHPNPSTAEIAQRNALARAGARARAARRLDCGATNVVLQSTLGVVMARGCGRNTVLLALSVEGQTSSIPGYEHQRVYLLLNAWVPIDGNVVEAMADLREQMIAAGFEPSIVEGPLAAAYAVRQHVALGEQAARDLKCPRAEVATSPMAKRVSIAEGCGDRASYTANAEWYDEAPTFTLIGLLPLPTTESSP
jgi:hypothetical protein